MKEPFAVIAAERRRELNRVVGSGQTSVLAAVSSVVTLITAVNKSNAPVGNSLWGGSKYEQTHTHTQDVGSSF